MLVPGSVGEGEVAPPAVVGQRASESAAGTQLAPPPDFGRQGRLVVLPNAMRDVLGLQPGSEVEVDLDLDAGSIAIAPRPVRKRLEMRDGLPVIVAESPIPALTRERVRDVLESVRRRDRTDTSVLIPVIAEWRVSHDVARSVLGGSAAGRPTRLPRCTVRCMHRTNIYLTEAQERALDVEARVSGTTRSAVLREILDAALIKDRATSDAALEAAFGEVADSYEKATAGLFDDDDDLRIERPDQ